MCAKIKLRLDDVDSNKYVKIPISLEFNVSGQDEVVERDFVDVETEKAVNPIVDFEKVRFIPVNTNSEEVTSLTLNLNFLDDDGELLSVTNYGDIGFVDNDIKYRKSKFLNSFLRLNFYDSDITTDQNLMSQTTVYSKITSDDIVGISEANTGGGGEDVIKAIYTITGDNTASCNSGMEGTIVVGNNDILVTNTSRYLLGSGDGTTIYINGTTPILSDETIVLSGNETYTFSSGEVDCGGFFVFGWAILEVSDTPVQGSASNDGVDSVGDTAYTVTGNFTANCSSGMGGSITVGDNDVLVTNSSYYYSGFGNGATIYFTGGDSPVTVINNSTATLKANTSYTFISPPTNCSDGSGSTNLTISNIAGQDTNVKTNPNDGGGLPLNANNFPVRFILTNPITNPKGFSEGFYLYHFKSEVVKDATMPKYLYMRAEFNNAATGETTRFITTTDVLPINLLMSNLHVRYLLTRTSSGYYYKIDNTYNNATNITESGSAVTLNLYEIRVQ